MKNHQEGGRTEGRTGAQVEVGGLTQTRCNGPAQLYLEKGRMVWTTHMVWMGVDFLMWMDPVP